VKPNKRRRNDGGNRGSERVPDGVRMVAGFASAVEPGRRQRTHRGESVKKWGDSVEDRWGKRTEGWR